MVRLETTAVPPTPRIDAAYAAVFALISVMPALRIAEFGPLPWYVADTACHVLIAGAIALRTRRVRLSFVAVYATFAAYAALVAASPVNLGLSLVLFAAPLSLWAVSRREPQRRWAVAGVLLGVIGATLNPAVLVATSTAGFAPWRIVVFGTPAAVIIVLAYLIPNQQRLAAERRETEYRDRAQAERLALSRDLHDVVGHGLTAISVRAQTALFLGEQTTGHREALVDITRTAADALADIRALIDALASDSDAAAADPREIPKILSHVPAAVSTTAPATEDLDRAADWPLARRLVLVRSVQEAVTNLSKHGDGDGRVTVAVQGDAFTVTATNTVGGSGLAGDASATQSEGQSGGRGLAGLTERVEDLGGSLTAEIVDGVFRLRIEVTP
ncbi:sensor histidine kinase [Corynebacterium uterequi]|uniref:histidine kinase n=1 Tax=Corynebacterium uterequi TaxID=1072256 RepID=A0A0G3HAJ6_9CORY|nr:histidine kinase [Corynebacterium uterequi]AKK10354.1 signal transduction histidine kinase [Corynebacterium uterequi]